MSSREYDRAKTHTLLTSLSQLKAWAACGFSSDLIVKLSETVDNVAVKVLQPICNEIINDPKALGSC